MFRRYPTLLASLLLLLIVCCGQDISAVDDDQDDTPGIGSQDLRDMLTPAYYSGGVGNDFRAAVDVALAHFGEVRFHHPLEGPSGEMVPSMVSAYGYFGAPKGPAQDVQHHPAVDLYLPDRQTEAGLYAAYDGVVHTYRDVKKYRHVLTLTRDVFDGQGSLVGKLVTLYAHIDLDLDEAGGIRMDGQIVQKGDLISENLYAGTVGGPHLHLEIRYYRPGDLGTETFYGSRMGPSGPTEFILPSAGPWSLGDWNPDVGYGFANPGRFGIG